MHLPKEGGRMMIDMQEANLVIIALEYHDEGVYKLQSLQYDAKIQL